MTASIEKSGTGINKSGTGIHQSGTGVRRGGTGGGKGGTGRPLPGLFLSLASVALLFSGQAIAADSEVMVSTRGAQLLVSLHTDEGIFAGGIASSAGAAGYYQVPLHQIAFTADEGPASSTQVKGTGSGSSGESSSVVGGSLMVQGTGSGSSGSSVCRPPSTDVKGTGSGSSGESSSVVGGSLMVQGTGSGNSGESSGGCDSGATLELMAEIVVDRTGSHVLIVDQFGHEHLVAFVETADHVASDRRGDRATRGFVATP